MDQKDLAAALGISPGLVSRLKRKGMPVHSVDAARRWRERNVNPYAKYPPPSQPPAPDAPAAAMPGAAPTPPPRAPSTVAELGAWALRATPDPADMLDAIAAGFALLPNAEAMVVVQALGCAADERLTAGRELGELEPALRAALRLLPAELRDPLPVSVAVMDALTAQVRAVIEASFADDHEREADRTKLQAGGADEARAMGAFWYRVAAGEVQVAKGGTV